MKVDPLVDGPLAVALLVVVVGFSSCGDEPPSRDELPLSIFFISFAFTKIKTKNLTTLNIN